MTIAERTIELPSAVSLSKLEKLLMHLRRIESLTSSTGGWRKSGEDDLGRLSQRSATRMHTMQVAWRTIEEPGHSHNWATSGNFIGTSEPPKASGCVERRGYLESKVSNKGMLLHLSRAPLGSPLVLALGSPEKALTALASRREH